MDRVWQAIDISENIIRTLKVVKSLRGTHALVMLFFCFLMMIGTAQLCWAYDLSSTLDVVNIVAAQINAKMPYEWVKYSTWTVLALTALPTVFEVGAVPFAREGATPFQAGVIGLSLFDMVTDTPASLEFIDQFWPSIESSFGLMAYPVYWLFWAFWLFLSSFGFEMICICMIVACAVLLLNMFKPSTGGR